MRSPDYAVPFAMPFAPPAAAASAAADAGEGDGDAGDGGDGAAEDGSEATLLVVEGAGAVSPRPGRARDLLLRGRGAPSRR